MRGMHFDSAGMCRLLGAFSGLRASVLASRALLVTCMLCSISTDHVTILQISGRWATLAGDGRSDFNWLEIRSILGSGDMRGPAVVFGDSFADL